MILTPVTGKPIRREYYGIGFLIAHRTVCEEAFHAKLEQVQAAYPDFSKLSEEKRAAINAPALIDTVVLNHDVFKDADGVEWSFKGQLAAPDVILGEDEAAGEPKYKNQTEKLLTEDTALRSWVYQTYNNISYFEDKKRAEVVKNF